MQEGVAWFGVRGSAPARVPVLVEAAAGAPSVPSTAGEPLVPAMEMYGVPLPLVAHAVEQAGGRVVAIELSSAGEGGWVDYRYAVTRAR